jgi:serine/threonine protein kinase
MAGCPSLEELRCYLNREPSLVPDDAQRIEGHIQTCKSCQQGLDQLTSGNAADSTTMSDLTLSGFRVYKHLGSGAFGEVWLAQDLNLLRTVALKTLDVRLDPAARARKLETLRNDARLLGVVEHPNVVRVYSWLTVHEQHYLVMQYVSGGSLEDLLKSEGPLGWQRAARYVADVGEGLLEVHAQGIVHRDVKPANILWDRRRDEALLTDFGVSARLDDRGSLGGSIPYMAPEAFDRRVSPSVDVYSLAATFFHLVTGSAPFPGSRIADVKEQIRRGLPDPDPRCVGVPEPLEQIIRSGLTADPEQRPGLQEFVSRLRGTLNQLIVDSFTMSEPLTPPTATTEHAPGTPSKPPAGPTTLPEPPKPAPVDLRLIVSRQIGPDHFVPLAATHAQQPAGRLTRDMKKVPPRPEQVRVRTGERVKVEVRADRAGFLTVFNVGPTGNLNLLYPGEDLQPASPPRPTLANQPLHILDVEMTAPAGRERLFAVWSTQPLNLEHLSALAEPSSLSAPYRATRDMKRVKASVNEFPPQHRHVVVVEVEHVT